MTSSELQYVTDCFLIGKDVVYAIEESMDGTGHSLLVVPYAGKEWVIEVEPAEGDGLKPEQRFVDPRYFGG